MNTTSALKNWARKNGVEVELVSPPRSFIAVLSDRDSLGGISQTFQIPNLGAETVISALLSRHLGVDVRNGEVACSTLEYALEEMSEQSECIVFRWTDIRYTVNDESKKGKRGSWPWLYLSENLSIQVFPNKPFVADDDAATFKSNLALVFKAAQGRIGSLAEAALEAEQRKASLFDAIAELPTS